MRTGISITLKPADRRGLKALARDRNAPHKHVWRAEIVLLSADGFGTNEIMRRTGKSKTCVWRWQERFMQAGYDSLLHDKTRPSRIRPLGSNITERVVALTQTEPPAEATHWTHDGRARRPCTSPPIGKPRRGRPSCHVRIVARCRNGRGHSELGAYIERAAGHRLPTALSGTAPVSATHFGSRKQGRRLSRLLMKFTVAFYPGDRAAIEFQHKQADGRRKISLLTLRLDCTSK